MSEERKYQASKSTSNKRPERRRDILSGLPHSEFLGIASTFSGLVLSLLLGIAIYNNTFAASSISITLSGDVELNLARSNDGAVYGKSSEQTAHVESDHFTGYTLTIAGSNDTGRLVGSNDSTKYLSSITTPLTESQFNTDAHNDQWGFLPSKLNSITNNSYQPSPTATTPTTIDVTNSPTTGENYTLALAARVSSNMSLDSYGQTFVLAATGNGYDYFIGYTDDLNDMPENQYGTNSSETYVNLSSTTPVKAGHIFKGWCDQKTTNNGTTCPGTTYPAGQRIDLNSSSANHYDLHAIWDPVTFAEAGATTMQSMTPEICNAVAIGQEGTLTDTRGGTYRVGKMKDGRCWMLDNLALGRVQLTPSDTNISANYIFPENVTTWADTYTETKINTESNNIIPQGRDPLKKEVLDGQWKVGTYYNYCAATAGTYCPAEGASTNSPDQDICPKGWRLPSGGPGGEFLALYTAYGGNYNNFRTSFRLPLSGFYYSAQVYDQGGLGDWWSSTFYNGNQVYRLFAGDSDISPWAAFDRNRGFSVRCVAE